jgi:hypothetical protein
MIFYSFTFPTGFGSPANICCLCKVCTCSSNATYWLAPVATLLQKGYRLPAIARQAKTSFLLTAP